MPSIKVQLSEETEKRFRETAMKRFGYGKGALSVAAEKALSQWAGREKDLDSLLEDIGDPVEGIEGMLSHLETDSVTLQHKASQIRARRALAYAVYRRKHIP
jgi:hypothetical protein